MTIKVLRLDAVVALARQQLPSLTALERENLLMDYWSMEAGDPDHDMLPSQLRDELARCAEPEYAVTEARYDELLLVGLVDQFRGVKNEYLAARLSAEGAVEVVGTAERLESCPCCGFRTLDRRGEYDICPVCFWEDDGTTDRDQYSDPNHITLASAQENFLHIGAASDAKLRHVLKDGKERYDK